MNNLTQEFDSDLRDSLKWLISFRFLFTILLLGSTLFLQIKEGFSIWNPPLLILYGLIATIFILTIIYTAILWYIKKIIFFAYVQIAIDITMVSLIIFLTGSFSSLFSFLYLVIIIYSSILLMRKGSMVMAALCSIQYGILVDLEYYGIIRPFGLEDGTAISAFPWSYVLYRIMIIMVACFAVAFLSGLLAEQAQKTRKELLAMEEHIKRVEKMAAIGEMAAGLAHEIKNPLASLSGSIQILKDEVQFNKSHEKLMDIVLREADRLNALVSNFLLFAKPSAGKIERLNLGKALNDVINFFEKDASFSKNIQIKKDITENIMVDIDPDHLRQILWNILLNASEAINVAGTIEINMYPDDKKWAIVKIADNGCGIPGNMIKTVFDPFVTTKSNGTGLGLSIVHRIVESYGCRLDIESHENSGTVVRICFKMADA